MHIYLCQNCFHNEMRYYKFAKSYPYCRDMSEKDAGMCLVNVGTIIKMPSFLQSEVHNSAVTIALQSG